MNKIRVMVWIDGKKYQLAAEFDDLDAAREYVEENNRQPGAHLYGIDPDTLPQSYYVCSQYESADHASGYDWSLDHEYSTRAEAIAGAVDVANTAMLDAPGTRIEVFVYRAPSDLSWGELADAETKKLVAYGKFTADQQGRITAKDLREYNRE